MLFFFCRGIPRVIRRRNISAVSTKWMINRPVIICAVFISWIYRHLTLVSLLRSCCCCFGHPYSKLLLSISLSFSSLSLRGLILSGAGQTGAERGYRLGTGGEGRRRKKEEGKGLMGASIIPRGDDDLSDGANMTEGLSLSVCQ